MFLPAVLLCVFLAAEAAAQPDSSAPGSPPEEVSTPQQAYPPPGQQPSRKPYQDSSGGGQQFVPQAAPAARMPLQGQIEESTSLPAPQAFSQVTPPATPPAPLQRQAPDLKALLQSFMILQGQQAPHMAAPPAHPRFIPGYAYTNEYMVAPYHNLDIAFWDKSKIPSRKKWIKLSGSVTRFWRGFVPEPCMVLLVPLANAPGNFSFSSPVWQAPRGWLQDTGTTDRMGFPLYRYWFDQGH